MAFSPDGTVLAIVHDGITIWECATWRCLEHLPLHPSFIGFSSDGRALISMEASGRISFWNRVTKQTEFAFDAIADFARPGWLALAPDDSCLALPTTTNQARLWLFDRAGREAVFLDTVQADADEGLAFSPDGTLLATLVTGKRSTRVRLYDVHKQEDLGDLDPDDRFLGTERSQPLAFSPGSDYLVAAACTAHDMRNEMMHALVIEEKYA
jgi:WD40 repeat protein